jgi:protein SCO1/2
MVGKRVRQAGGHRDGAAAAIGAVAACLLVLAGLLLWLPTRPPVAASTVGGPFRLLASNGRTVDDRSFPGRYKLVYFGYTQCRDVCPTAMTALADALRMLGPVADRVQPLFVTVDPAHDTPPVLRRYLAQFTPRLLGLTGTPAQVGAVERAYRVTSVVMTDASGAEAFDHSSVLYLMRPDGRFLAPLRADETPAVMAATLARALR